MSKRFRFIYTRTEGGQYFRGFDSRAVLINILESGQFLGKPITFIRGSMWNFDFVLQRPRIDGREVPLTELWYRSEWEKVDLNSLTQEHQP